MDYEQLSAPQIPANMEAEQAVLGAMLIDPDASVKIGNILQPSDFFRERHEWIFSAMMRLNERWEPIDFVTLQDELGEKLMDAGGAAYITELSSNTPTSLHIDHYARIVKEAAIKRKAIAEAGKLAELAYSPDSSAVDVSEAMQAAAYSMSNGTSRNDPQPIANPVRSVIDRIDYLSQNPDATVGVPTGFSGLDRMLGGLQRTDLIILGARPGMGKSSMALNIAQNAAEIGARVAIFTLEMSNEQLVQRLLSTATGIDSHRLRMGDIRVEEWPALEVAANKLAQMSIMIDNTPAISVAELRSKARRIAAEGGLDLLIIDYMQLMSGGTRSENRQQEISHISRSLKALAQELRVPVLALSQLSRALESRADKQPMLSDLRESGSLEQDADVVAFIYREDYYIEDTDRQNIADIIVAKHRHGSTGTVSLYFRKELTQFSDLEIERTELI